MKRMLATIFGALMLLTVFAVTASAEGKAGPNGSNEKGLCTAYFNGQKNGHDKDGTEGTDNSPAFQGLEDAGREHDAANNEPGSDEGSRPGETALASDVFEFCDQFGIMGNPEQNGRFDCRQGEERDDPARDTDDADGDGEIECLANGTETD
jgi:hypothetical protein